MMAPPFDQRWITAEHEAAHVVTYLATGCGFHYAEIEPDAYTASSAKPATRHVWTVAVTKIAGVVIEDRYVPVTLKERIREATDFVESGEDEDSTGDMYIFVSYPQLATPAYTVASGILTENADALAEVAGALYEFGHLTRRGLQELPLASKLLRNTGIDTRGRRRP